MPTPASIEKQITVHVVYALPHIQHIKTIQISSDSTLMDALKKSSLLEEFPALASEILQLGVFGKVLASDTKLDDGMRVEIYRPLIIDPKESRRKRALLAKK